MLQESRRKVPSQCMRRSVFEHVVRRVEVHVRKTEGWGSRNTQRLHG